jgi:hypothetical protein
VWVEKLYGTKFHNWPHTQLEKSHHGVTDNTTKDEEQTKQDPVDLFLFLWVFVIFHFVQWASQSFSCSLVEKDFMKGKTVFQILSHETHVERIREGS